MDIKEIALKAGYSTVPAYWLSDEKPIACSTSNLERLVSFAEALVAELAKENKPVDIDLRKDRWNQLQICTWIGNKLMSQPAMFERHEVCRFVRNLGRSEVLAKLIAAAPKQEN